MSPESRLFLSLLVTLFLGGVRTNTFEVVKTTPKPDDNNTAPVGNIHFHFWSFGDTQPSKNTSALMVQTSCVCEDDLDWYIIRNPHSGLVVHLNDFNQAVIYTSNGHPRQLWKFVPTKIPGVHHIVNKHTGTLLDIVDMSTHKVVVNRRNDGRMNQRWMWNSDGHLYNVGMDKILDITREIYSSGTELIVFGNKWGANQKFALQKTP